MAGGSTRLLDGLRRALEAAAGRCRWSLGKPVFTDRLHLPVLEEGRAGPLFEVVIQAKGPEASGKRYAETARFRVYYTISPDVTSRSVDAESVSALMDDVVRWLRRSEHALAARWSTARRVGLAAAGAAAAPGRATPGTTSILERGHGLAKEHILRIDFRCNQRCPFCFVRRRPVRPDWETLQRALDEAADRDGSAVNIVVSGGEPTLHPDLFGILERIRARRPRSIQLQTNAVRLADGDFAARLGAAGVRACFVSLHSHREETYDRITQTSGQFPRAVRGIRNLLAAGEVAVTLNILVNRLNVRSLVGYVGFVSRLRTAGGRPPGIFFTLMNDVGLAKAPHLAVSLEAAAPLLDRAVTRCAELGIGVSPFAGACAPPLCVLRNPEPLARVAEDDGSDVLYVRRDQEFEPHRRVKRLECRTCRFDARCVGVWGAYAHLYGLEFLRPIRR